MLFCLFFWFGFLPACQRANQAVQIAVVMPLTGDEASDGVGVRNAVELAVEQGNGAGGLSVPIEVAVFDDRADPKEAVNVANLIASKPGVVAVIGHLTSGCSIPASRIYAKAGIPMITPTAINPEVTFQQLDPTWTLPRSIFRLPPLDREQSGLAARFAYRNLKLRRFAVIDDKTSYGQGLAKGFSKAFMEAGGTVLSYDSVAVGDKDFKALLTRIKAAKPDGLYYGGFYSEFGHILKQSRELGFKPAFMSGSGSKTNVLFNVAAASAQGAYLSASGISLERLPRGAEFARRYHARFPGIEMTPFDHYGYMAAQIVLESLRLRGPDRAKLLEAIRDGKHAGILGTVEFDEKGDNRDQTASMTRANAEARSFDPIP